ncbi:MAG: DUF4198 domain-containing protein [Pirellulales bacterium]|nr:DUF4198 domain-containing protein [Pirellulales bacterium]
MKPCGFALILCAALHTVAYAHFIWIVPEDQQGTSAKVVFSEDLQVDENVPIENIGGTRLRYRDAAGNAAALQLTLGEHAYLVDLPGEGTGVCGGVCQYGVIQRGQGRPFLLMYYPKFVRGPLRAAEAWEELPLEILPQGDGRFQVLFSGKPVPEAEVVAVTPAGEQAEPMQTGADGTFRLKLSMPGLYGLRARHVEAKSGEIDGRAYEEVRHYATLVFRVE